MKTKALDLGCGLQPNNLFKKDEAYGIDIRENTAANVLSADLAISPIPFPDNYFDCVTALDFIEHIPRVIYNPNIRFCFVELMNEIYRVLKPDGYFYSRTPAYPASAAFTSTLAAAEAGAAGVAGLVVWAKVTAEAAIKAAAISIFLNIIFS